MIRTITPYLKRAPFYIACNPDFSSTINRRGCLSVSRRRCRSVSHSNPMALANTLRAVFADRVVIQRGEGHNTQQADDDCSRKPKNPGISG